MGTRGATKVIRQAEEVVSQYGQWDHYPSGNGIIILEFLRTVDLDKFNAQLDKCHFLTEEDQAKRQGLLDAFGSNGWLTGEQSTKYDKLFPFDSRDHGADILNVIYNTDVEEIDLIQQVEDDCLEGVYTINLDDRTFTGEFHGVGKVFSLDDLPTNENFIEAFKKEDE